MLKNTRLELSSLETHKDYLNHGGHFTFPEYEFVLQALENGFYCPTCPKKRRQILGIASLCNLEVTETEISIYTKLRGQIEAYSTSEENFDERAKSACCMEDDKLVAAIFFLTDGSGEKHRAVTERFSFIFEDS